MHLHPHQPLPSFVCFFLPFFPFCAACGGGDGVLDDEADDDASLEIVVRLVLLTSVTGGAV